MNLLLVGVIEDNSSWYLNIWLLFDFFLLVIVSIIVKELIFCILVVYFIFVVDVEVII